MSHANSATARTADPMMAPTSRRAREIPVKKFGPIHVTGARLDGESADVDVELYGKAVTVRVTRSADRLVASVISSPESLNEPSVQLPVEFLAFPEGGYGGPLTLPQPVDAGWVEHETEMPELCLAAGGKVGSWVDEAGATIEGTTVRFPGNARLVAVVACAATRVLPVVTGYDLSTPPPWELPPPIAKAGGRGGSGWGGKSSNGQSTVARLELNPKLVEAVNAAITATGQPRVDYGIVEHFFAFANPDDYRELHELYGHIAVDHPLQHTLSSYLARRLADLIDVEVAKHKGRGTGYWDYNSGQSAWSAIGVSATTPIVTWSQFATEQGWHPKEWRAASLLWGEQPIVEREWSGYRGPGEFREVKLSDVPTTQADERFGDFVESFDAPAAFGGDLEAIHDRLHQNFITKRGLPRDLGLRRGALWVERQRDTPDDAFVNALLRTMTWCF